MFLAIAAKGDRLLVTHDRKTIPYHFAKFISSQTSPGFLIVTQKLSMADVVEDLIFSVISENNYDIDSSHNVGYYDDAYPHIISLIK